MEIKNSRYFHDADPWMLAEDIPECDFAFSQIWLSAFVNDLATACGKNYKKILCFYRGFNLTFYYGQKDSDDFAKHLLKFLVRSSAFGKKMNRQIRNYSNQLKRIAGTIKPAKLRKMNSQTLANFYLELDTLHTTLYSWGWLPNAVDMFHGNFTTYLQELLAKKLPAGEVTQALVALSFFPEKSAFNREHESFLHLVALKQRHVSVTTMAVAIRRHLSRFFYLKHLWVGRHGVYTYNYYVQEINRFIKSGNNAAVILKKEDRIRRSALKLRQQVIKKCKLASRQISLFNTYAEFAVTKAYRRDAQLFWAYKMDSVFQECARRFKITAKQARFMFPEEITQALEKGVSPALKKELHVRETYCAYYAEKGVDKMLYGKKARLLERRVAQNPAVVMQEIRGQTACLGKAIGTVRIVNTMEDMKKLKAGDVLVSIATNPDIVPAMKKAAAVVTEQGGVTSHAAIVSRELNIPCIIGTKVATKVLKDGDRVEVDANKGIVRKI